MLTNNEIVEFVNRKIDISTVVKKNIQNSITDGSFQDLSQYIYLKLLQMDNGKLNDLYERKLLGPYIVRMVLNQRNDPYKNTAYYNECVIQNNEIINDAVMSEMEDDSDLVKKEQLEFLEYILNKYDVAEVSGYTVKQNWEFGSIELLKMNYNRGHSIESLSKAFKMPRRTVFETLKYAKAVIKNEYEKRK